jgi:hypothetical protein
MNISIRKTLFCTAILAILVLPFMGNTALSDSRNERIFYFNSYDQSPSGETWETNPGYMVDGDNGTFASTTIDRDIQLLNGNTCDGSGSGSITEVYLRTFGYWNSSGEDRDIILRPVFGGVLDGDDHIFNGSSSGEWSEWFDITNDTNSHTFWTWPLVQALDCDVEVGRGDEGSFTLYCSIVQIRVIYTI